MFETVAPCLVKDPTFPPFLWHPSLMIGDGWYVANITGVSWTMRDIALLESEICEIYQEI